MNEAGMTLRQISEFIKKELKGLYDQNEIQSFIYFLLEHFLHVSPVEIMLKSGETVPEDKLLGIKNSIIQLREYLPIQYILGKTEFCGLTFDVTRDVLIPRPETEELVRWIIHLHKGQKLNILDIGTGSGCIAISLAANLAESRVTALDISKNAIRLARKNAKKNHAKVKFVEMDILNPGSGLPVPFDLIVSNPPYVLNNQKSFMARNVLDYEPHQALFVPDEDPLLFYRKILNLTSQTLQPEGYLYFEINESFHEEIVALMKNNNFAVTELRQDIHGKYRMLSGRRAAASI